MEKKKSPIYSNIFLTIIALTFIILYVVKCSNEPEPQQPNIEMMKLKHQNDSLSKSNVYLKKRTEKLIDSIYKFHIGILKPDFTSSFWYVTAEDTTSGGSYFSAVKLSTKIFSLTESEDIMKRRYKSKGRMFIRTFVPITEYCYLQFYNKYLRKYDDQK